MQTPISFILDLILDYDLPQDAQKACRKYIRDYERGSSGPMIRTMMAPPKASMVHGAPQAPSAVKALQELGQVDIDHVAQTAQAAQAIASRQNAIAASMSGKPEAGRTSPKKW